MRICTSGLPSDVNINIGEMKSLSISTRRGLLEKLIEQCYNGVGSSSSLRLDDIPGGAKAFELVSRFRYGVKTEYLEMTDDYGDRNLVMLTETFLDEVLGNWADSIRALEACEQVMPHAEELHIVSRLILAIGSKGMRPERIAASVAHYAWRYLPLMNNRQSSFNDANHVATRALLEEIVGLLPNKKGALSSKFLIRLLRTATALNASSSCGGNLEKRVGAQLDQASLCGLADTKFEQAAAIATPPSIVEEGQLINGSNSLTAMAMVASLVDGFLAEVAPHVNFKLSKFEEVIPNSWLTYPTIHIICEWTTKP
ncbi:hypothetical protein PTKIN_Ptkin06aG0038700 [Pterospermum kingtungense]